MCSLQGMGAWWAVVGPLGGGGTSSGHTGKGRSGGSEGGLVGPPLRGWRAGKKFICPGVIWQDVHRAGVRSWWMRSMLTNFSLPEALEMRISSTGHLAASKGAMSPSVSLWAGMNRMCSMGIWTRVSTFRWLRIPEEFQGVSSQTGRTMTTRKGVVVCSDEPRARRMAFCMSSRSYSGLAMQEPVHR